MIGSKVDLDSEREVTYEEGLELMKELKMDLFFETSAKKDIEIERMFRHSAESIINQNMIIQQGTKKLVLQNKTKSKKNCC